MKLSAEERSRLGDQLIRLGDGIAEDDEYGAHRRWLEREYKRVMYLLHPETKPKKKMRLLMCEKCGVWKKKRLLLSVKTVNLNCFCGHKTTVTFQDENENTAQLKLI